MPRKSEILFQKRGWLAVLARRIKYVDVNSSVKFRCSAVVVLAVLCNAILRCYNQGPNRSHGADMFDFSLPQAIAVLPIEPHDFQAPSAPLDQSVSLLHANVQAYGYTSEAPTPPKLFTNIQANYVAGDIPAPPPSPKLSIDTLANYSGIDNPAPPPSPKLSIDTLASYSGGDNPQPPPPSQ
jgi:hypothetical protein